MQGPDDNFSLGFAPEFLEAPFPASDAGQPRPLSVSEAMQRAKGKLESVHVRLMGEVSEFNSKAGYKAVYFTVKDSGASLPCMMWMNRYKASGVELRLGAMVELEGRFTLYAPKGRMNFDVFQLELTGEGKLRMQVAQVARKLEAEGLTSAARKRPLPESPEVIGVVTSPRGDAVHDVLRTLRERYPLARVVLAGVAVEGPDVVPGIIDGLACVVQGGAEVVLLVRGGGSYENLMPFNSEELARAVAACPVPVVTGVGHEPDTTLVDLVSDRRAATPTAAAIAASPHVSVISQELDAKALAMRTVLSRRLDRSRLVLARYAEKPVLKDPLSLLGAPIQQLDGLQERLRRALPETLRAQQTHLSEQRLRISSGLLHALLGPSEQVKRSGERLRTCGSGLVAPYAAKASEAAAKLDALSPLKVLSRGYAYATTGTGDVVRSVGQVSPGDDISLRVADGAITATVQDAKADVDAAPDQRRSTDE